MTNPTPPGQVPMARRYKIGYASDSWGERSSAPSGIPCPTGAWVRHEDHVAAIAALRAQQGADYDHGPQAETVEEAARDVGKWLNERPNRPLDLRHVAMLTHHAKRTQQPAPAGATDLQLLKFYGVSTDAELIAAQASHIERLQAKLPQTPSFAPKQVREG